MTGKLWLFCCRYTMHTHTHCQHTHTHTALLPLIRGIHSPQCSDSHKKNRILLHTWFTLCSSHSLRRSADLSPMTSVGHSSVCRRILFHLNLHTLPPQSLEVLVLRVSSHPVLPHQRDDAGWRTRLRQEGMFKKLTGCGPLSRISHQHPVQEALEQRGDLGEGEKREREKTSSHQTQSNHLYTINKLVTLN